MDKVLIAVAFVGGIGLLCAVAIALVSKFLSAPADEKAERIQSLLPGANCGACGFSGCSGYASALSSGKTDKTNLCVPGGSETAAKIAAELGTEAGEVRKMTAVVRCRGAAEVAVKKMVYEGAASCRMAGDVYGGEKLCAFGCVGFGDCVKACPFDALSMGENGLPRVDKLKCKACGKCVSVCPKGVMALVPADAPTALVACRSAEKGAVTRKACSAGCIGCMKCQKVCEAGAVSVTNFLAAVDPDKCVGCGKCVDECPTGAIKLTDVCRQASA